MTNIITAGIHAKHLCLVHFGLEDLGVVRGNVKSDRQIGLVTSFAGTTKISGA